MSGGETGSVCWPRQEQWRNEAIFLQRSADGCLMEKIWVGLAVKKKFDKIHGNSNFFTLDN